MFFIYFIETLRTFTLLLGVFTLLYFNDAFKKEASIGELLTKRFENEIYKEFDTLAFDAVFKHTVDSLSHKLSNTPTLKKFYSQNSYHPQLIINFYQNNNLDSLVSFLQNSEKHGFNPKAFSSDELLRLLQELKQNKYTHVSQSYATLARVELLAADAYINYVSYLKYGVVDPRKIFSRYFITVKRPGSQFAVRLLNSENMTDTLVGIQHKSSQYKALQVAYLQAENDSIGQILAVNMERLRWILPPTGEEYVQVNIPDFNLVYFKQKDTLATMKVCVGSKADLDYDQKMERFKKTNNLEDKPNNHETPLLFSSITMCYANPEWNIPESIAKNEIFPSTLKNRGYLSKNEINVFYKNKLVRNPYRIRWSTYSREKLPFRFVQKSGLKNALGKFKFAFENNSSIYLHDTNNKKAFKFANRAVSHGCIRLEKPLKFAELLVSDKDKYDKLRAEVGLAPVNNINKQSVSAKSIDKPKYFVPESIAFTPKKPIPLLITYFTAWEKNNRIEYRPDVYGLDQKLWLAMNKSR